MTKVDPASRKTKTKKKTQKTGKTSTSILHTTSSAAAAAAYRRKLPRKEYWNELPTYLQLYSKVQYVSVGTYVTWSYYGVIYMGFNNKWG